MRRPELSAAGLTAPLASCGSLPCTSAAFAELSADILGAGLALRFQARGTSMAPLVRDGDVLLIRPLDGRPVQVGDVVLCRAGDPHRVVVHRVVRRHGGHDGPVFAVQGDQAAKPDGLVPASKVHGRLVAVERGEVTIAVDWPLMRLLGRLVALRSRWNVRGARLFLARRWARRLPGLSKYLA